MKTYVYWIAVLHKDSQEVARGWWGEAGALELLKSGSRNEIPIIVFNDRRNDVLDPPGLPPIFFSRLEPFYVDESMI